MEPESQIRALLDRQSAAIRYRDVDSLMAVYAPDIVYFDVVPPLQFVGSQALRERFTHWFSGYRGDVATEVHDLRITVAGDMAVACWFSRVSGTLNDGRRVGSWVRATTVCRKSDDGWLVTHEHVSLPTDMASGTPALHLTP